ncbi:MAG: DnaD domain protein [Halothermotrichaceae bacterium]
MNKDKLSSKYSLIPSYIFADKRLNFCDISLITTLYHLDQTQNNNQSKKSKLIININMLLRKLKTSKAVFKKTINRLKKYGWIKKVETTANDNKLSIILAVPDHKKKKEIYNQPGSKIARSWKDFFGTRMLKYEEIQDFKDFIINKGVEEDLIIKLMEISSKKADGNPFYYIRATLINFVRNGILTLADYEEKQGNDKDGQISKINRKEKTGFEQKKFKADEYR